MIGNAEYQCQCVRYIPQDNLTLIICLSVGLGLLLLIIIIIIIVILCRRRRNKKAVQGEASGDNRETAVEDDNEPHYSKRLPDDYIKDSASESHYSKRLPDDYVKDSSSKSHYNKRLPDDDIGDSDL